MKQAGWGRKGEGGGGGLEIPVHTQLQTYRERVKQRRRGPHRSPVREGKNHINGTHY